MKIWHKILVFSLFSCLMPVMAFNLDEARRNGTVTERPDGYLQANDASAQAEVDKINNERRKKYQEIAKKEGIPVEAVASMAAEKLMNK
jgi:uncharacterized protein